MSKPKEVHTAEVAYIESRVSDVKAKIEIMEKRTKFTAGFYAGFIRGFVIGIALSTAMLMMILMTMPTH